MQRAPWTNTYLNRAGGADSADLFQRARGPRSRGRSPRQPVPAHPLACGCSSGQSHAGAAWGRWSLPSGPQPGHRNDGIGPGFGHGAHGIGQTGQFAVIDQRIQGNVYLYAAGVAETDSLFQLVRGKVARGAAGVESRKAQITTSAPLKTAAPSISRLPAGAKISSLLLMHPQGGLGAAQAAPSSSMRRFSEAFSRRVSSAAILALAASSR